LVIIIGYIILLLLVFLELLLAVFTQGTLGFH